MCTYPSWGQRTYSVQQWAATQSFPTTSSYEFPERVLEPSDHALSASSFLLIAEACSSTKMSLILPQLSCICETCRAEGATAAADNFDVTTRSDSNCALAFSR